MATHFDVETYKLLEKPVILAASSCRVTDYRGQLQLSATAATHCYFNPNIEEVEQSLDEYKTRFAENPRLEIDRQRYEDEDKESLRNRFPLNVLLTQNPDNYKSVRFTCEGTVTQIDTNRQWYYNTCPMCNKKLTGSSPTFECRDHSPQPTYNLRYSFKAFVKDETATTTFTFFSPGNDNIVGTNCDILVKDMGYDDPHEIPPAIRAIEKTSQTFQFHYNPLSRRGSPEFIVDDTLTSKLPTTEPSKETPSPEQTRSPSKSAHIAIDSSKTPPELLQVKSTAKQDPSVPHTSSKRVLFQKPDHKQEDIAELS